MLTLRAGVLKLPKEPSLGSSGGGAIPSSENRVTVGAWSLQEVRATVGGAFVGCRSEMPCLLHPDVLPGHLPPLRSSTQILRWLGPGNGRDLTALCFHSEVSTQDPLRWR